MGCETNEQTKQSPFLKVETGEAWKNSWKLTKQARLDKHLD